VERTGRQLNFFSRALLPGRPACDGGWRTESLTQNKFALEAENENVHGRMSYGPHISCKPFSRNFVTYDPPVQGEAVFPKVMT
jgi:hypothetical protein